MSLDILQELDSVKPSSVSSLITIFAPANYCL